MSGHVNEVTLIGTVCRNPVPKLTKKNNLVTTFTIVTEIEIETANGNKVREKEFHEIIVWGGLANLCAKNLVVGRLVWFRGRIRTTQVTNSKTRYSQREIELVGEEIRFLDTRPVAPEEVAQAAEEEVPLEKVGENLDNISSTTSPTLIAQGIGSP